MILEGRIDDGDTVKVTASDSGLVINGEKAVAAAAAKRKGGQSPFSVSV